MVKPTTELFPVPHPHETRVRAADSGLTPEGRKCDCQEAGHASRPTWPRQPTSRATATFDFCSASPLRSIMSCACLRPLRMLAEVGFPMTVAKNSGTALGVCGMRSGSVAEAASCSDAGTSRLAAFSALCSSEASRSMCWHGEGRHTFDYQYVAVLEQHVSNHGSRHAAC